MGESANTKYEWSEAARRIGDAVRDARDVLGDLDAVPWNQMDQEYYTAATWTLDVALREILDAVDAATALVDSAASAAITAEGRTVALQTEVSLETCAEIGCRRIQDWLAWSAVCEDARRRLSRPHGHPPSETEGSP